MFAEYNFVYLYTQCTEYFRWYDGNDTKKI